MANLKMVLLSLENNDKYKDVTADDLTIMANIKTLLLITGR
jgi:hypothetical protein